MDVLRRTLRVREGRDPEPSVVMIDCQATKGGRGGSSFHETHGKYLRCGANKTIAIDYLGLPVGAMVHGARRHDVRAARDLLAELLPAHPRAVAVLGDRGSRGLAGPIAREHDVIVLEDLNLVAMTRSAKGTIEEPGRGVAQKAGLNRSLQDAALGRLAHWIHVKAECAGRGVWLVDPRYTSQRCSTCQHTDAANRPDQATFACVSCGHADNADINAAVNIAKLGAQAEQAWDAAGRPSLERPKPRMRRGIKDKPKVASVT